jgi:hypothetical protein
MNTPRLKFTKRPVRLAALVLAAASLAAAPGCTDLVESPVSALSPSNYYKTDAQVLGGVVSVYNGLRSTLWNYYNIAEISSDEQVVPTRGSDWFDNGQWLELHRQTWGPSSSAGLAIIGGAWGDLWTGVAQANTVINALAPGQVPSQAVFTAELRGLRAYYYMALLDLFGGVPIVTTTDIAARPRKTRAEVFAFVESELIAARADLPATWDAANQGRLTKGAMDAMLASLYLNATVYTGTVAAAGLTPGAPRWADVITVADRILSGPYALVANGTAWRANFAYNNQTSTENIMVVRHGNQPDQGLTFLNRAGHYNSGMGGWNGFAAVENTYNSFNAADPRRGIFLVGPQVNLKTGAPINDRAGNPLVFTATIANITTATEGEGARFAKFSFDPNSTDQNMANDYTIFRLGEVVLMKAEALNETGNLAGATTELNRIRTRQGLAALAPASQAAMRNAIYNERLYEMAGEGKRRQDMIRLGASTSTAVYTAAGQYRPATTANRVLMPIPSTALATNPLLVQNPGY